MAKADHGMIQRLMFVLILMMLVTGFVKSWAVRKNPDGYARKQAGRFAAELQAYETAKGWPELQALQRIVSLPKDGWGNPFLWKAKSGLLSSAGNDEIFGTDDDLHFAVLSRYCTQKTALWLIPVLMEAEKFPVSDLNSKNPPTDLSISSDGLIVLDGKNSCPVPGIEDIKKLNGAFAYKPVD
jgi:hypothetical protein